MIRELIDIAVRYHYPLVIEYSKDGRDAKVFNLGSASYSTKYGNNYISAFCNESQSELTFKIDKILHVDLEWVDVFPPSSYAPREGLYIVACRSDMHLEFDLRQYAKGDNLLATYTNEGGIESSYSQENFLAYHYVPFFMEENQKEWIPFEKNNEEMESGCYILAYILTDAKTDKDEEYDWVDDYDNWIRSVEFPCRFELANTKAFGIHYTLVFFGGAFDRLRIASNIKVLAYHYCSCYTEVNHSNHWSLVDELGLIKEGKWIEMEKLQENTNFKK